MVAPARVHRLNGKVEGDADDPRVRLVRPDLHFGPPVRAVSHRVEVAALIWILRLLCCESRTKSCQARSGVISYRTASMPVTTPYRWRCVNASRS